MEEKQKKRIPMYSDPKRTGVTGVILAVISLFIFGFGLSIAAAVLGAFGVYYSTKKKSGVKILLLNILAIVLGMTSNVLLNLSLQA